MEQYSICVAIIHENLVLKISISILLHASKEKIQFYYTLLNTGKNKTKKKKKMLSSAERNLMMNHAPFTGYLLLRPDIH